MKFLFKSNQRLIYTHLCISQSTLKKLYLHLKGFRQARWDVILAHCIVDLRKEEKEEQRNGKFNISKLVKILANWWFIFMFLCPQEGVEGQHQNPFQHFSCVSHSTNNQPTLQHLTLRKRVELWLTGKKASPSHGCWEECGWWGPSGLQQNLS